MNNRREDPLPRQAVAREIGVDSRSDPWQRLAERQHAVVLGGVADIAPAGIGPVLLSAARVTASRLEVPVWNRADPDVGVGRGDAKGFDSRQCLGVGDSQTVCPDISERPLRRGFAANSGPCIVDITQVGRFRRRRGVFGRGRGKI